MRNRYVKKNQYESELSILVITVMSLCVSVCNNCHLTYLFVQLQLQLQFVIMLMKYSVYYFY
jgi:hypothetical protein